MPRQTPFHDRTAPLCQSHAWKQWGGYLAVNHYSVGTDREYFAFRETAGMLDVSPLYKYDVRGADASVFLSRIFTRDVSKMKVGRVAYGCLCDHKGMLLDDGTVHHIGPNWLRDTTSERWLSWLSRNARGFDVAITDVSAEIGGLAVQGPLSREALNGAVDFDLNKMRFFRVRRTQIAGIDVQVSRTGYTGDLGFEVWVPAEHANTVWDTIMESGKPYGLEPVGLDALDITRIEAGFVLQGVDYVSARSCLTQRRMSTPDEAGLDWTIDLDRDYFIGQEAIRKERENPSKWCFVGLEMHWEDLESLYNEYGLPPDLPAHGNRSSLPLYTAHGKRFVGYASSSTWSPVLKKGIALATVDRDFSKLGEQLLIEHTPEFERRMVRCSVVERPFFDPPRKRSVPTEAKA